MNVIYPCCTSFDSVRSFTSGTTYTTSSGGTSLSAFGSVTPTSSTGIRATYTVPGPDAMTIVQDTDVVGTTFEDSRVVRQTSITNNGGAPLSLGIRYLWDYEIGDDDGPTFQPLTPDGSVLESESDFGPPGFETYRIVDNDGNPTPPTFAVLGTVNGPTTLSPQPTPPTLLEVRVLAGLRGHDFRLQHHRPERLRRRHQRQRGPLLVWPRRRQRPHDRPWADGVGQCAVDPDHPHGHVPGAASTRCVDCVRPDL